MVTSSNLSLLEVIMTPANESIEDIVSITGYKVLNIGTTRQAKTTTIYYQNQ